jgi:hypothetical protein
MMHQIPHPQAAAAAVPAVPAVQGDINGDSTVDVNDLLLLLGSYGSTAPEAVVCDINTDGAIDVNDLLLLLGNYGSTGQGR